MRMDTKKHEAGRVFEVYLSLFHGFTSSSIIFMNYAEVLKNFGNFTLADYIYYILACVLLILYFIYLFIHEYLHRIALFSQNITWLLSIRVLLINSNKK